MEGRAIASSGAGGAVSAVPPLADTFLRLRLDGLAEETTPFAARGCPTFSSDLTQRKRTAMLWT